MADLSAPLGPLMKMVNGASEYLEFWREYKDEEILIRSHRIDAVGNKSEGTGNIEQSTFVIRGTVKEVSSFPPGFLLEDVEEYIELSNLSLMFTLGTTHSQGVAEGPQGKQTLREIDEKYVSFSDIDQVERAEAADDAVEPFRSNEGDEETDS